MHEIRWLLGVVGVTILAFTALLMTDLNRAWGDPAGEVDTDSLVTQEATYGRTT